MTSPPIWPWQATLSIAIMICFVGLVMVTLPFYLAVQHTYYMSPRAPRAAAFVTMYNLLVVIVLCTQCLLISLTHAGYDVPNFPCQLMLVTSALAYPCCTILQVGRVYNVSVRYDTQLRDTAAVKWLNWRYRMRICLYWLAGSLVAAAIFAGVFSRYNTLNNNRDGYQCSYLQEWYVYIGISLWLLFRTYGLSRSYAAMNDLIDVRTEYRVTAAIIVVMTYTYYVLIMICDIISWSDGSMFNKNKIELQGLPFDFIIVLMHILLYIATIVQPMYKCHRLMYVLHKAAITRPAGSNDDQTSDVQYMASYWKWTTEPMTLSRTHTRTHTPSYGDADPTQSIGVIPGGADNSSSEPKHHKRGSSQFAEMLARLTVGASVTPTQTVRPTTWTCMRALRDPAAFKLLHEHSHKSLNSELLMFWSEVDAYSAQWQSRHIGGSDTTAYQFCSYIYAKYIRHDARFELNIADTLKRQFAEVLRAPQQQKPSEQPVSVPVVTVMKPQVRLTSYSSALPLTTIVENDGTSSTSVIPKAVALTLDESVTALHTILVRVQRDVYRLIDTNVWPSYRQSPEYKRMCADAAVLV